MMYFCTDVVMVKDGIMLLPNAIKDVPHSVSEVDLKGGSGEAVGPVGIRITFGVVSGLNATLERSKAA